MPDELGASLKFITVRGFKLAVGDTSDRVVSILRPEDRICEPTVLPDPALAGSLEVTQHYLVNGRLFSLVMARREDPGPYRVKKIIVKGMDVPLEAPTEGVEAPPAVAAAAASGVMDAAQRLARTIELGQEAEKIMRRLGEIQAEGRQLAARLQEVQAEVESLRQENEATLSRQQKRAAQRQNKKGVH